MRDPKRIPEILQELGRYWARHPDLRLGQLVVNACLGPMNMSSDDDPFNVEDDVVLARLRHDNANDLAGSELMAKVAALKAARAAG